MFFFPTLINIPKEQQTEANFHLRYEDVAQDGRLKLSSVPHAFSESIWIRLLGPLPMYRAAVEQGILPILSGFLLEGEEISIGSYLPLQVKASYHITQTTTPSGEVDKLYLNFWATLFGREGHPLSYPDETAELKLVGSAFAEHVFTKPFAATKEERRVRSLASLGGPTLPYEAHPWPARGGLALPEGAEPLEDLSADSATTTLGLLHTDGNQHVNSLAYPRLFEEAALRRFSLLGLPTDRLVRKMEIRYRKPCFAGESVRFWVRAFMHRGSLGVLGILLPEGSHASWEQSRCVIIAQFQ